MGMTIYRLAGKPFLSNPGSRQVSDLNQMNRYQAFTTLDGMLKKLFNHLIQLCWGRDGSKTCRMVGLQDQGWKLLFHNVGREVLPNSQTKVRRNRVHVLTMRGVSPLIVRLGTKPATCITFSVVWFSFTLH